MENQVPSTSTATHEQIETLLDFLQEHRDLARGFVRSVEGRIRSRTLWDQITTTLNSLGGAVKTPAQWQKVWADRKYNAKKMGARRNRAASGTGGGPSTEPPPSEVELKVLAIMGDGFGAPQTTASIPAFVGDENVDPNSQTTISETGPSRMDEEPDEGPVSHIDHPYASSFIAPPPIQTSTPIAHGAMNAPSRGTGRRLSQLRQRSNLRGQLLDLEGAKIREMAAMRAEVTKLREAVEALTEYLINRE